MTGSIYNFTETLSFSMLSEAFIYAIVAGIDTSKNGRKQLLHHHVPSCFLDNFYSLASQQFPVALCFLPHQQDP
jgi:hypothetical protein